MISERLREPHGSIEDETTGVTRPLFDPMRIEAADVIDALVAALECAANEGQKGQLSLHTLMACGDALAMARKP